MLGLILSNIHLNDFCEIDICNFAGDTTPFVCHKNLAEILEKLERNSELAIHWFEDETQIYNLSSGPHITHFSASKCFKMSEHSVQTADYNSKLSSKAL